MEPAFSPSVVALAVGRFAIIHFQCPKCGKGIKVGDAGAGKDGKCPACGAAVHVPETLATVATGPPPLKRDQRAAVLPADAPPSPDRPTEESPAEVAQAESPPAASPTITMPTFVVAALGRLSRLDLKGRMVLTVVAATVLVPVVVFVVRPSNPNETVVRRPLVERPALSSPWAGFRGITWKMKVKDLPDLQPLPERDGVYYRPDDVLKIGDAELSGITYEFYKSQFYRVIVYIEGEPSWIPLRDAILARYGEGRKAEGTKEAYTWRSGDVAMILSWNGTTGFWWMTYQPLNLEREADDEQRGADRAQKAAFDF